MQYGAEWHSGRLTPAVVFIIRHGGTSHRRSQSDRAIHLSELFPKPDNPGLQHIWRYGSADLLVYRGSKPVAIIEPGGGHHFEEKQSLNDRRKWKLAELHGVRCLNMMNGLQARLSKRKWRELIGGVLFRIREEEDT